MSVTFSTILEMFNLVAHNPDELWLADNTSDAVIKVNDLGTVHYANPAVQNVFGWRPNELVGRNVDLILPFLGPTGIQAGKFDSNGKHKDGTELALSISFATYSEDDVQLFVGVLRDRSAPGKSEKNDVVPNSVRHALNQPLSTISTALYLVKESPDLDDNSRRLLTLAIGEMDYVVEITRSNQNKMLEVAWHKAS